MTIWEYKKLAEDKLHDAGVGTAELDVLVLLEDLLHTNRAQLLAHTERELSLEQQKVLNLQIERRKKHEPLAYIRGKSEFYGREFIVNKHVLEPRPESETMIEMLKHLVDSRQFTVNSETQIADIGTGSGALAVTAKKEFPQANVIATDIDKNCLKIAGQNAAKHSVDITFLHGDLLSPVLTLNPSPFTLVLANLPYVPDNFKINEAAIFEPRRAIFGGPDGLDLYRKFFSQLSSIPYTLYPKPYVLTESLPSQHEELAKIAKQYNYQLEITEDFIQQFSFQD